MIPMIIFLNTVQITYSKICLLGNETFCYSNILNHYTILTLMDF